jgi:hypothetical protein
MLRYMCTNPACLQRWHYTTTCPWRGPSAPPARRPLTAADRASARTYMTALRAGDFDLRRTPSYMRERRANRAPADSAKDPGHRWLLAFVPVALLMLLVMVTLVVYVR